jgi:hypothetical protein
MARTRTLAWHLIADGCFVAFGQTRSTKLSSQFLSGNTPTLSRMSTCLPILPASVIQEHRSIPSNRCRRDPLEKASATSFTSMTAAIASGWSICRVGTCNHWKTAALSRRIPVAVVRVFRKQTLDPHVNGQRKPY